MQRTPPLPSLTEELLKGRWFSWTDGKLNSIFVFLEFFPCRLTTGCSSLTYKTNVNFLNVNYSIACDLMLSKPKALSFFWYNGECTAPIVLSSSRLMIFCVCICVFIFYTKWTLTSVCCSGSLYRLGLIPNFNLLWDCWAVRGYNYMYVFVFMFCL